MFKLGAGLVVLYVVVAFTFLSAWLTHVIVTIQASAWLFLIAGAIFAPIGVIHGIGVWFGAW